MVLKDYLLTVLLSTYLNFEEISSLKTATMGTLRPSRLREVRFYNDYDEYNCEDFETWEEAQEVFESSGGVENDIHRLDHDNDGIPCEALR